MIRFRISVNGSMVLDRYGRKMLTFDKRMSAEKFIRDNYAGTTANIEIIEVRDYSPKGRMVRAF